MLKHQTSGILFSGIFPTPWFVIVNVCCLLMHFNPITSKILEVLLEQSIKHCAQSRKLSEIKPGECLDERHAARLIQLDSGRVGWPAASLACACSVNIIDSVQHVRLIGCGDQRAGVQKVCQSIFKLSMTKTLCCLWRALRLCMALVQHYLQDDSWCSGSETPQFVYVS